MAGCYNGDPATKEDDRHGVDFTLRGPPFVIGEGGYRRNYGKEATGLPGNLKLGAYFNGGSAAVFGSGLAGRPSEAVQARYGFYVLGDRALARWGDPAEKRHLGMFAALVCAPDQRVNTVPYFFDAGSWPTASCWVVPAILPVSAWPTARTAATCAARRRFRP